MGPAGRLPQAQGPACCRQLAQDATYAPLICCSLYKMGKMKNPGWFYSLQFFAFKNTWDESYPPKRQRQVIPFFSLQLYLFIILLDRRNRRSYQSGSSWRLTDQSCGILFLSHVPNQPMRTQIVWFSRNRPELSVQIRITILST